MRALPLGFAAAAILLAPHAPSRAGTGEPLAFRSDDGRFSILFPENPPETEELRGERFSVTDNNARHAVELRGAEFAVEIHDIPRAAAMVLSSSFILDRAKLGMLGDMGAEEIDSKSISRQAQPGRLVRFAVPDRGLVGQLLMVLARRRLYLVSVRHRAEEQPPASYAPFFESFEFWLE